MRMRISYYNYTSTLVVVKGGLWTMDWTLEGTVEEGGYKRR